MNQSLQTFANEIIDYAGLFPPASLDLKTSFTNYLKYLESPYNWLLSKFVIPAKLLSELTVLVEQNRIKNQKPIQYSVLGGKEVSLAGFFKELKNPEIKNFFLNYSNLL